MPTHYDLLIRGGRCVTPGGIEALDIGILQGRIRAIGVPADATAGQVFDARGLHVMPGVIDAHVHLREPGAEHKEDISTGTAAAAIGGVTTIFDMPNNAPPTTTEAALTDKLRRARNRSWVDYAFFLGATPDNTDAVALADGLHGCAGVKVFMGSSTGDLLLADDDALLRVLAAGRRRVAVHAEDEHRLLKRRELAQGATSAHAHPGWRDPDTALRATRRLLALSVTTGRRVHVLHVSTGEEIELLCQYKELASVEVTVQHLSLASPDCYDRLGTLAQMNPPLRDEAHREALWAAVRNGAVDSLASDHAPHTRQEKARPYPTSPSGMPGLQTLLPVMLDHVAHGRLSLERLADLTSAGPARVYGIAGKGRIAVGWDADLALVDLAAEHTITDEEMKSRCGWTPYHGLTVRGWPVATVVRGKVVAQDGELQGTPSGAPVRFAEAPSAVRGVQ